MDSMEAARVLASVEGAQRRARETMWASSWLMLVGASGLGLVAGLAVLVRAAADWVVWLDRAALVLLLVGCIVTIRTRKRVGIDPVRGSRWVFGRGVASLLIVGVALVMLTALQDVGILSQFLPAIELLAAVGTVLVAVSLVLISAQARIWVGGVLAVGLLAVGAAAWILAPVQSTGLMMIAIGLSLAVLGVSLRLQFPPRPPAA